MKIRESVYMNIVSRMPVVPPETGGIIGSIGGIVDVFVYDEGESNDGRMAYKPRTYWLNKIIQDWHDKGIKLCGILHTHPYDQRELSGSDKIYIKRIMQCMPGYISKLYFPVVFPGVGMIGFCAENKKGEIIITTDEINILKE